jgi:hypothetical protein
MSRTVLVAGSIRGTALAAAVSDPARLLASPEATFVKDHRRTAVARLRCEGVDIYVKRFKPYAWYRRVEAALTTSPARLCWESAERLETRGFAVPRRLSMAEEGGDSYFVTEAVRDAEPAADFWLRESVRFDPRVKREILRIAARTLRSFHDSGLYSRDTNANNFLLRIGPGGAPEFFFLDLENVRFMRRVGRRRRVKNLVQLYRLFRDRARRREQLQFLLPYLGYRPPLAAAERQDVRAWLRDLIRVDLRKEDEYRARARRQVSTGAT